MQALSGLAARLLFTGTAGCDQPPRPMSVPSPGQDDALTILPPAAAAAAQVTKVRTGRERAQRQGRAPNSVSTRLCRELSQGRGPSTCSLGQDFQLSFPV